ncbi:hypothetical protein [Puniceicoccus vermicola]|uniref:Uncharacterized protein n=1 Tax=Puniceicoccus vermicola TaxID=388746 RepID=A0A7X1E5R5_9BACT|nr:hypothetical protein [Puniceicoccus vermicola]MBC2601882.1 hypothetical protein [Puniceicoccus vermicola]
MTENQNKKWTWSSLRLWVVLTGLAAVIALLFAFGMAILGLIVLGVLVVLTVIVAIAYALKKKFQHRKN